MVLSWSSREASRAACSIVARRFSTTASACCSARAKRSRSMVNSGWPFLTTWLSTTVMAVTRPETSGASWTTSARTRPSRVQGARM